MVRKTLLAITLAIALIIVATIYVALQVGIDLYQARSTLTRSPASLSSLDLKNAESHLSRAARNLGGFPANVLHFVPIVGQNVDAVRSVAEGADSVVGDAARLRTKLDRAVGGDLIHDGTVNLPLVRGLSAPLKAESGSLAALGASLKVHTSGWLVPPLYDALVQLQVRTREIESATRKGVAAARIAPALLGGNGAKRYLVLFLNNAELRGAGGIVSTIGTLSADGGKLKLGRFYYHKKLAASVPLQRVPAPPGFHRRFGRYKADTTGWVNTSASPRVPDVAAVARRLYEVTAGSNTNGAILVDPRGLAALLPPGTRLPLPRGAGTVLPPGIPQYVYSRAYSQLGGPSQVRRDSLTVLGREGFKHIVARGLGDTSAIQRISTAAAAGHVRFVSFDPAQQRRVERLGASGEVGSQAQDVVVVNSQNLGADKLDYWMRRTVRHACNLDSGETARCTTMVRIANHAPDGLPLYVRGGRPSPRAISYLEIYVPHRARVTGATLDGRAAKVYPERDGDLESIGTNVSIPQGKTATFTVAYTLPLTKGRYSLEVEPQPLAIDAKLSVALRLPSGWKVTRGPGQTKGGLTRYQGSLLGPVRIDARESATSRPGLSGLWDGVTSFLRNPVSL